MSIDMSSSSLTAIVAATRANGIGHLSSLPWRLSNEMAYFARVTKRAPPGKMNAVIMGRKSWDGIPLKFRPLVGRRNIVISRQTNYELGDAAETYLAPSLPCALSLLSTHPTHHKSFIIGGSEIYRLAFPALTHILLTRIRSPEYEQCDAWFPEIRQRGWRKAAHEELEEWTGGPVPKGIQTEVDKLAKEEEKMVEYEFELWVRDSE